MPDVRLDESSSSLRGRRWAGGIPSLRGRRTCAAGQTPPLPEASHVSTTVPLRNQSQGRSGPTSSWLWALGSGLWVPINDLSGRGATALLSTVGRRPGRLGGPKAISSIRGTGVWASEHNDQEASRQKDTIGEAMVTSGLVKQAYCTACGAPIVDGGCSAACSGSAPSHPVRTNASTQSPDRRPAFRKFLVGLNVAALLAAGALAGAALTLAVQGRADLDRTTTVLETTQLEQLDGQRRLAEAIAAQQNLAGRLGALEAELRKQPSAAATAKTTARSVFTIVTDDGSGSGFVVAGTPGRADVVTNFHVVAESYLNGDGTVEVVRGDLTYTGQVTDVSESNDLALITVPNRLPALNIGDRRPAIGAPVLVLGSPLGLGGTVTSGIVSAFRTEEGVSYLQFSAPISPGNSGGPVVDERGNVVGVAVAKMVGQGAEGLGFAIPASRLCTALDVC